MHKLKNDDYLPTLTDEHPELDLKFVIEKKIRKGLKPLVKEDDAPVLKDSKQIKKADNPNAKS